MNAITLQVIIKLRFSFWVYKLGNTQKPICKYRLKVTKLEMGCKQLLILSNIEVTSFLCDVMTYIINTS
jgi:hypothetical protein